MRKTFILVAIMCLLIASSAFAADIIDTDKGGENGQGWVLDTNYTWKPGTASGIQTVTESATTSDTLTAREAGKTIVYTGTSGATFTLPTAAAGLEFTFIHGNGYVAGHDIQLDPQDADTIRNSANALDAGDKLQSPATAATGDSVTLVAVSASYWYVKHRTGTWTDDGA